MDINDPRYIDFLLDLGGQRALSPVSPPTWTSELADAYAQIEQYNHRVGLVLFHTRYRYLFLNALSEVMTQEPWGHTEQEHCVGTLWGASVWCSPRAPQDRVLLAADPQHIDPKNPGPGLSVEIVGAPMFPTA